LGSEVYVQLEFFEVPSPCVGICQSNDKGLCIGCMRSRKERQEWRDLANDEKQKVIKRCIQRKKRLDKQDKETAVKADSIPIAEDKIQPSLLDTPSNKEPSSDKDLDFSDFEL
jgi:predicted Fe-S protein YdhL (DUF1289 family)